MTNKWLICVLQFNKNLAELEFNRPKVINNKINKNNGKISKTKNNIESIDEATSDEQLRSKYRKGIHTQSDPLSHHRWSKMNTNKMIVEIEW